MLNNRRRHPQGLEKKSDPTSTMNSHSKLAETPSGTIKCYVNVVFFYDLKIFGFSSCNINVFDCFVNTTQHE